MSQRIVSDKISKRVKTLKNTLVQDIRNHGFQKLEAQKKMKSMK